MTLWIIRFFFVVVSTLVGYQVGQAVPFLGSSSASMAAVVGAGLALSLIAAEFALKKVSTRGLSAAVFGLLFGLILARLIITTLELVPMGPELGNPLRSVILVTFSYLGMAIALRERDEFNIIIPYVKFSRQDQREELVILDTSVVIDGRIADICQTRFLEGRFIVPRFVLKELQQIADSQDSIKRNRGRRGLDVLARIQKIQHIDVRIHEEDFAEPKEVDAKLVKLAKLLSARILTNDFNLNKIAELQGVQVLNINELANALKPVVLPGEVMEARVIKEGKEYNQGVAYLDDGTMVVVEQGRNLIGQTVRVLVTSVLQTAAGRMIFAKPEVEEHRPAWKPPR
ncbi:MAG: TRAM domain-containing protein [Candidatus Omnitrophica bacterium]|nr:TRAM domain-containing protein [Candidatus Omnitrophota bacterium]